MVQVRYDNTDKVTHFNFRQACTNHITDSLDNRLATTHIIVIGVLVALQSSGDSEKLNALGRQLAMHVAATNPLAVSVDSLDPEDIERERAVLVAEAKESGKPDEIIDKMVEGRLRKFYEEVVLTSQVFVIDGETRISKVLENAAADVGAPVELTGFARFELGEGVDKGEEADFAAEVAAAVSNS